ncbi:MULTISPECIES: DUF6538 domain-containing protein [Falsihalocynthiibacter]|uniref:DUF6538 domain-containing protein n=1 Tax=Falsihalocynthiibacter TaxID=2854182 RepID=UPI003001C211
MAVLKNMAGHPRLYRRNATYYHRAAIPKDIANTYPKAEETFSLGATDHREAVRIGPIVSSLSPDQIQAIKGTYFHYRLEEDDESRITGFKGEVDRNERFHFETAHEECNEKVSQALTDTRNSFEEYDDTET